MQLETSRLSLLIESTEIVADVVDALGVAILGIGILVATIMFLPSLFKPAQLVDAIGAFKVRIGRAMLLALEVLIAADIVKTVALEPTLENMATLGLLVIVRTFLSWALSLEIEGHWPWQSAK